MANELQQIAKRIKELREILELTPEEVSKTIGFALETYLAYENAQADIPISALYEIAGVLGVDPTVLMTGTEPKMSDYTIVRGGNGLKVERYPGYDFTSLAYNYKGREMEPLLVTLNKDDKKPSLVTHGGQEFNYVISGTVIVTINNRDFELNAGDSIYFNPRNPHGQRAGSEKAEFITIINE